jgi:hypothetical protein
MKQVVLITGASSGIGRATAELLSTRTSGCAHPFASWQNPPVFNYPNPRLARVALPYRGTLRLEEIIPVGHDAGGPTAVRSRAQIR